MITRIVGEGRKALDEVGGPDVGFRGDRQRIVGVAAGLLDVTPGDRHANTYLQQPHPVHAHRRREGIVDPKARCARITLRQRNPGDRLGVYERQCRQYGRITYLPGRLAGGDRRCDIPRPGMRSPTPRS